MQKELELLEPNRQTVEGYRLSPQQRRVWKLLGASPAFRLQAQCAINVSGRAASAVLRRAVERLVRRHEVLRTEFQRLPGMEFPIQVIASEPRVAWREVDLRRVGEGDKQDRRLAVVELMARERALAAQAGAEAESGMGVCACLGELSDEERVMVVSVSGMAADSRTMMNMVRELGECYAMETGSDGEGNESDEVVQYVQFSEWQNELLEGEDAGAGREYWAGVGGEVKGGELRLPFERVVDSEAREGIAELEELEVEVNEEVAGAVAKVAVEGGVSEEALLLTCWQALLARLTAQNEIAVSMFLHGRSYEEMQSALGLYAKWPHVWGVYYDEFPFSEILSQVYQTVQEDYEWQEYCACEETERSSNSTTRCPRPAPAPRSTRASRFASAFNSE